MLINKYGIMQKNHVPAVDFKVHYPNIYIILKIITLLPVTYGLIYTFILITAVQK